MARTRTKDVDPARSAQMARVRGKDTKPEMKVRRALHGAGLRFRLQARDLPGRPDIIFRTRKLAIFVHGCFWHRHTDPGCKLARTPKSRLDFWLPKFQRNQSRDAEVKAKLAEMGWRVIEVWECQIDANHLAVLIDDVKSIDARRRP